MPLLVTMKSGPSPPLQSMPPEELLLPVSVVPLVLESPELLPGPELELPLVSSELELELELLVSSGPELLVPAVVSTPELLLSVGVGVVPGPMPVLVFPPGPVLDSSTGWGSGSPGQAEARKRHATIEAEDQAVMAADDNAYQRPKTIWPPMPLTKRLKPRTAANS
jgi:hypothetical protein